MQLSERFSLEEFVASETAVRRDIDNTPPPEILAHLRMLAAGLEKVRLVLNGKPIHVNSGYRCPRLNSVIGGAQTSAHMKGLAADILCPQFGSPLEVCKAIATAGMQVDQVIHEYGHWCHVAFPAPGEHARAQTLTIASHHTGYRSGLHSVG
jgi:hypothetical protein